MSTTGCGREMDAIIASRKCDFLAPFGGSYIINNAPCEMIQLFCPPDKKIVTVSDAIFVDKERILGYKYTVVESTE